MKKLNITKEQFNRSRYFKNKYGELEYVSESGKVFKTNKGKVLMFKEGTKMHDALFDFINALAEYCDGYYVNQAIQEIQDPVMRKKFEDMWQDALTDRII